MQSIILKNKREIEINGYKLLDLQERSVDMSSYPNTSPLIIATIEVTDTTEGRVDILSTYFYGNAAYGDFILKFNGISNPFAIEVGDILYIPELINYTTTFIDNTRKTNDDRLVSTLRKKLTDTSNLDAKFSDNITRSI
jgi:hypothetical protein